MTKNEILCEENVRYERTYEQMEAFAAAFQSFDGMRDVQDEIATEFGRRLSEEARAKLIFQLLTLNPVGAQFAGDGLTPTDKRFAVTLATTIGPDWAQWLYRFAVTVTKLA